MPALYKFPPHPLCPHIQFKQVGRCYEDELPPWPEPALEQPGSTRYKLPHVERIAREDSGASNQGPASSGAAGAHHETPPPSSEGGHPPAGHEKPPRESRRERQAATLSQPELDAQELHISYSMATVPDCTVSTSGIHVSQLPPPLERCLLAALPGRALL